MQAHTQGCMLNMRLNRTGQACPVCIELQSLSGSSGIPRPRSHWAQLDPWPPQAFLIGIPLYTVMRIAARQARQEQYEAMLRSGAFEVPARRFVWRVQAMQQRERDVGHAGGGLNAV